MVMFLSTSFKVLSLVTSSILRPGFGRGSERIGIFMVRVSRIRGYTANLYKIPESQSFWFMVFTCAGGFQSQQFQRVLHLVSLVAIRTQPCPNPKPPTAS